MVPEQFTSLVRGQIRPRLDPLPQKYSHFGQDRLAYDIDTQPGIDLAHRGVPDPGEDLPASLERLQSFELVGFISPPMDAPP
jgi:hypothetical protein